MFEVKRSMMFDIRFEIGPQAGTSNVQLRTFYNIDASQLIVSAEIIYKTENHTLRFARFFVDFSELRFDHVTLV